LKKMYVISFVVLGLCVLIYSLIVFNKEDEDEYVTLIQNPTVEQLECLEKLEIGFGITKENAGPTTVVIRKSDKNMAIKCK